MILILSMALPACDAQVSSDAFVALNPSVEDHCMELDRVKKREDPGGSIPDGFPLPRGATIVGSVAGDPPVVHLTAPGDFLDVDSFFKSALEDEGWSAGSSGNGSDPTGRYGYVLVDGHGWKGEVTVITCGEAPPGILVELEQKRRPR